MNAAGRPALKWVKEHLQQGKPTFGLIATIPSVQVVQILTSAGFVWLIIDQEHAPIDMAAAHAMIVATADNARGFSP